ncbi:LOW QUALITY PROTEIN: hypothetical protein CVT25_011648, partial [Psilocybe cyanescens]
QIRLGSAEEKLNPTRCLPSISLRKTNNSLIYISFITGVRKPTPSHYFSFMGGQETLPRHGIYTRRLVKNLLSLTNLEDPKQQAFHVAAPSLPGFICSSSPKISVPRIGFVFSQLMLKLGYTKYIGQGGDWGSYTLRSISPSFPNSGIGIRLNFLTALKSSPWKQPFALFSAISPQIKRSTNVLCGGSRMSGGMARFKPRTCRLYRYVWDPEVIITRTILYLLSRSSWHTRIYKEGIPQLPYQIYNKVISNKVAFGLLSYDIAYLPIWWAKASLATNIVFWKEHSERGHYAATETLQTLKDIREFVASSSEETRRSLRS